jgi:hypothetical protein
LIHPRNDRVEVAATNHVPFAADFKPLMNPTSQDSKLPLTTAFFLRLVHAVQV